MPRIGHRHACRGAGPPISGGLSPWIQWLWWGKPGGVTQVRPLIGARDGPGVLRQSEPPRLGRIGRPAQRSAAFPLWARSILIRIFFSTTSSSSPSSSSLRHHVLSVFALLLGLISLKRPVYRDALHFPLHRRLLPSAPLISSRCEAKRAMLSRLTLSEHCVPVGHAI